MMYVKKYERIVEGKNPGIRDHVIDTESLGYDVSIKPKSFQPIDRLGATNYLKTNTLYGVSPLIILFMNVKKKKKFDFFSTRWTAFWSIR